MHISLDEAKMIPYLIHLTPTKISDRRRANDFRYLKRTIVVDDHGYFDCELFATRIDDQNHFVTRMKSNTVCQSIDELGRPDGKDQPVYFEGRAHLPQAAENTVGWSVLATTLINKNFHNT